ncbi:MAG: hypothetical protein JWO08_2238 [Verrucomicrobiaceae bacterium]|nr:hypothetical protein [Verrucomicrobiaceae bacterium]
MTCPKLIRVACVSGLLGMVACAPVPESETRPQGENVLSSTAIHEARSGKVDFATHVKPVLEAKCVVCHNRRAMPGYMSLENRAEAKRSGALGSFIISGHPEHSLLIAKLKGSNPAMSSMPVVGMQLTPDELAILTQWVKQGAHWPAGAAGTLHIIH